MKTENPLHNKSWVKPVASLLSALVICAVLVSAQSTLQPTQETVEKRVNEIMELALKKGVITLPDGVRATPMRANTSLEELQELRSFGERAISPLSKYLDSTDLRAQTLAVNLVGAIGGKSAIRPLSYAADRCTSAVARLAAVENLGQQPWADVVNVIERVSANDPDPLVKKAAQEMVAKHRAATNKQ